MIFLQASITIVINSRYNNYRSDLNNIVSDIQILNNNTLRVINLNSRFFRNEITNINFFKTGESDYIIKHKEKIKQINSQIAELQAVKSYNSLNFSGNLDDMQFALHEFDSLFTEIYTLILRRGYNNYGLVGEMYHYEQKLEQVSPLNQKEFYELRQHEKDYFIRNEYGYVLQVNELAENLISSLKKREIYAADSAINYLKNYQKKFNTIVILDNKIGLEKNIGLKKQLEIRSLFIEAQVNHILSQTRKQKEQLLAKIKLYYIFSFLALFLLCLMLSGIISKSLTKALSLLSDHIANFVSKDFKLDKKLEFKKVSLEVANINRQFNSMVESLELREQQRNQAVLSLSTERKRYHEMAKLLPLSIFETNSQGFLTFVNDSWLNNFGYLKSNWNLVNIKDIITQGALLKLIRENNTLDSFEFEALKSNNERFPALLYFNRIKTGRNEGGIRGVIVDITERVKYINALKKEKERAQESDRLKTAFLANVSHEIRTPMNAILGFSEILVNQYDSNEETDVCINQIRESSDLLLNLIDDLIDLAKIESGRIEISKKEFNFEKIVSDLNVHYLKHLEKNKPNLKFSISKINEGNYTMFSDDKRIRQVLINLVNNAIKFTAEGFITLSYSIENDNLQVSVSDTGIGISKKEQKYIFERFRQANDSISSNYGGTGLGLSISKQIVELLGGFIMLESEEGKGSTFTFEIPCHFTELNNYLPANLDMDKYNFKEYKFLIAEDDNPSFVLTEKILRLYGADVIRGVNGKEAIEKAANEDPDLILMDMNMPMINGLSATEQIKSRSPYTPIIIQTAYAMESAQIQAKNSGADDFITKPLDRNRLLEKIDILLLQKQQQSVDRMY